MTPPRRKRFLDTALGAGVALGALVLIAGVVILAGFYNVGASGGHGSLTTAVINLVKRRSIAFHSMGVPQTDVTDEDLILLGAGHFQGVCAECHGAPGAPPMLATQMMLPEPPELSRAAQTYSDAELFWIIKHGLKYTGMPAWPAQERDDEIWALAAFVRSLPAIDAPAYLDMVKVRETPLPPSVIVRQGAARLATSACARCHGDRDTPPASALVPVIAGQSAGYLAQALEAFASGERPSGIMGVVARELDLAQRESLARYYASLDQPAPIAEPIAEEADIALGRRMFERGLPEEGVPACIACHSGSQLAVYPQLLGQQKRYLRNRLELWRTGRGRREGLGLVMAPIAERLSEEQVEAVTAYLANPFQSDRAQVSDQ